MKSDLSVAIGAEVLSACTFLELGRGASRIGLDEILSNSNRSTEIGQIGPQVPRSPGPQTLLELIEFAKLPDYREMATSLS
jgi:hypothetical protein